jgi:hypothetical protein
VIFDDAVNKGHAKIYKDDISGSASTVDEINK